jgi:sugar-specific transcriptional regulator TrmB
MEETKKALEKYGLNKNEIALYVASLQLGEAGMSKLAKKSALKRTTAYIVAEGLIEKGILGSFKMKRGTRYIAKDPKKLIDDAETKLELMKSTVAQLEKITKKDSGAAKVTFYTGKESFMRIMEESLKKPNVTLRHIGSLSEGHKITTPEYGKSYLKQRVAKNIKLRALYTRDFPHTESDEEESRRLRHIKYLPENWSGKTLTLIFENKVIITTSNKDISIIVIESKEIAQTEKEKFDLIWGLLK